MKDCSSSYPDIPDLNDEEDQEEVTISMSIPSSDVGRVIGKGYRRSDISSSAVLCVLALFKLYG